MTFFLRFVNFAFFVLFAVFNRYIIDTYSKPEFYTTLSVMLTFLCVTGFLSVDCAICDYKDSKKDKK
jgi:hypothetical protein